MRKITLTLLLGLLLVSVTAQTIVGTTPQNKKGVLEEFTGTHCGYCPQGHAIANSIKANNPDSFYIINIHNYNAPGPGEPDFRTPFGAAIANQSQLYGYPAGTVNRHYFGHSQGGAPAGATALGRDSWSADFNTIKVQPSYVNVGVEAEIDAQTNVLTIHVEAYYTSSSSVNTNFLNIALLQNNTRGPQAGGNAGDNYNHQHRLVHMITGQWGESITTTTTGTFVDRTFTYTMPNDYNGVLAEIGEFEVVAFVAESHQEIISASGSGVNVVNALNNDVMLKEISSIGDNCTGVITPKILIQNRSASVLTSLVINYVVNSGVSQVYNWSGSLNSYSSEEVVLPEVSFVSQANNTLNISFPSDDDNSNNSDSVDFGSAPVANNTNITIEIKTDNYGSETSWELINAVDNSVVVSGGPYTNVTGGQTFTVNQSVADNACYKFKINDGYGDGMCCTYGNGYYKVLNGSDVIVEGASFTVEDVKSFEVNTAASVLDDVLETIKVYPSPANSVINIDNAEGFNVQVFNILGKKVFSTNNLSNKELIDVTSFDNGTYFVKLNNSSVIKVEKIIVLK